MKKIFLLIALLSSGFAINNVNAQLRVGLNLNIGSQPIWGPVGYDHVEYYYMPDIDAYYYVPNKQYIYRNNDRWAFSYSLPARFHNYDIYSGYKVVINQARPYNNAAMYRSKYAGFKGNHDQELIRNSHETKYFENKDHPEHNKWEGNKNNGKDNKNNGKDNAHKGKPGERDHQ